MVNTDNKSFRPPPFIPHQRSWRRGDGERPREPVERHSPNSSDSVNFAQQDVENRAPNEQPGYVNSYERQIQFRHTEQFVTIPTLYYGAYMKQWIYNLRCYAASIGHEMQTPCFIPRVIHSALMERQDLPGVVAFYNPAIHECKVVANPNVTVQPVQFLPANQVNAIDAMINLKEFYNNMHATLSTLPRVTNPLNVKSASDLQYVMYWRAAHFYDELVRYCRKVGLARNCQEFAGMDESGENGKRATIFYHRLFPIMVADEMPYMPPPTPAAFVERFMPGVTPLVPIHDNFSQQQPQYQEDQSALYGQQQPQQIPTYLNGPVNTAPATQYSIPTSGNQQQPQEYMKGSKANRTPLYNRSGQNFKSSNYQQDSQPIYQQRGPYNPQNQQAYVPSNPQVYNQMNQQAYAQPNSQGMVAAQGYGQGTQAYTQPNVQAYNNENMIPTQPQRPPPFIPNTQFPNNTPMMGQPQQIPLGQSPPTTYNLTQSPPVAFNPAQSPPNTYQMPPTSPNLPQFNPTTTAQPQYGYYPLEQAAYHQQLIQAMEQVRV